MTLLTATSGDFLITYTGTGIPEHAIHTGDTLVTRLQDTAQPGQLVVTAGTNNTVKRYEPGDRVLGVVTWVARRIT